MNRRDFSTAAGAFAGATLLGVPNMLFAQGRPPQDGNEYRSLDKRLPVATPAGKIEVIEFFWYSCPHCNAFEPKLVAWTKRQPADVVVRRVPAAFRDSMVPQQRLYYTLEAMGKVEELHGKVYEAIHANRQTLDREESILEFAQKNGLDRAKFQELYNSFGISTKARQAAQLQDAFRVGGVPSLGIGGRYYTDGDMAGNMDRALLVADFLVALERRNGGK